MLVSDLNATAPNHVPIVAWTCWWLNKTHLYQHLWCYWLKYCGKCLQNVANNSTNYHQWIKLSMGFQPSTVVRKDMDHNVIHDMAKSLPTPGTSAISGQWCKKLRKLKRIKVMWTLSTNKVWIVDSVLFVCMPFSKWQMVEWNKRTWYCMWKALLSDIAAKTFGLSSGVLTGFNMGFLSWSFLICMSEPSKASKKLNSDC